jgi:predicted component of type VI protein secretion system
MLQGKLRVVGGTNHGKVISLSTRKFLIGREQDCQLRPNSEMVSRHHCVFTLDDFNVRLRDLGSTNGTFVNDERVRGEVMLKSGDRVQIGKLDFEIVISAAEPAASAEPNVSQNSKTSETTELSAQETQHGLKVPGQAGEASPLELPAQALPDGSMPDVGDTTVIAPLPNPVDPAALGYPPQGVLYPQPVAQYPQQPVQYFPPGQYPQQPFPFPQPGVQYQPPLVYPQQPGTYPVQPVPQAPTQGAVPESPVKLPDPNSTGAQPEEQKPSSEESVEKNPSEKAADIIRQHMHRRRS